MKSVQTLPEGSRLVLQLDLQKDKKTALKVNLLAVVILAAVVALGVGLEPLGSVFRADSPALYWGRLAVLLTGAAAGTAAMLGWAEQRMVVSYARWLFAVVGILMLALFAAPLRKGGKRACVHTK